MKAWVFVEGDSDRSGLDALWAAWRAKLRARRAGIQVLPLKNKVNFLKKFGERAAEKLVAHSTDVVVGMPDLHPVLPIGPPSIRHTDAAGLKEVQINAVRKALRDTHTQSDGEIESSLSRLLPSLFKHDFEMLLLAAKEQLRTVIGTTDSLGGWREIVEEQDLDRPPKRIVEELIRTKSKRRKSYLATRDAPAVLRRVSDVRTILKTPSGQCTCPEFVRVLDWLGEKLGEQCLELD